jgi:hypothetical protein
MHIIQGAHHWSSAAAVLACSIMQDNP